MIGKCLMRVLLCGAPLFLNGCVTHSLWTGELTENYYEPSVPNRLALFQTPEKGDILVAYDELSPWRDNPRRRAYFVQANIDRIESRKKPRFVSLTATNGLSAIPLIDDSARLTNSAGSAGVYAISFTNENRFAIISATGGREVSSDLPTYKSTRGNAKLVLLTPVTVALNASIVGGAVGYFCLNALAQSGSSFTISPGCR